MNHFSSAFKLPRILLGLAFAAFWITACTQLPVTAQPASPSVPQTTATGAASDHYLPLAVGLKWVLVSPAEQFRGKQVVLNVEKQEGSAYWVRFNNPWNTVAWKLEPNASGDRFELRAIEFGGSVVPMPDGTTYFRMDEAAASWKNAIGTLKVQGRNFTAGATDATPYKNVIHVEEISPEGNKMVWGFARGVGFVQFGEGDGAFVLDRAASVLPAVESPSVVTPIATPIVPPGTGSASTPIIFGISDNPTADVLSKPLTEMSSADLQAIAQNTRELNQQARALGIQGQYISARWDEMQKEQGGPFDFKEVEDKVNRAIDLNQSLELFTLRFPDTNNKPAPKGLTKLAFDDPKLRSELDRLLPELLTRLQKNKVRRFSFGNEIDSYFKGHKKEVAAYLELVRHVEARVKQLAPGIQFSSTVTIDCVTEDKLFTLLQPVLAEGDFFCVTYYPLSWFKVQSPDIVAEHFAKMRSLASSLGQQPIVMQEVGYPSGKGNNSSPEKQAQFYKNVLTETQRADNPIVFLNFFLMCDLPQWMVDDFARYYMLPGVGAFKSYLRTLGIRDDHGTPKPAWNVIQTELEKMGKAKN